MEFSFRSHNHELLADDPFFLWVFGIHIVSFVVYWSVGCIYIFLDVFNPQWSRKYKTQLGKNEPVSHKKMVQVIKRVLYNQIVIGTLYSFVGYFFLVFRGNAHKIREIPTLFQFIVHIALCIILREIHFYYSHRILHKKWFYEKFHKKHHDWTAPIAVSAQYAGIIEHIFSNLFPVTVGIFYLGLPLLTSLMYLLHVTMRTLNDHSGYNFPYYYSSIRHDWHHESFNSNFGVIGLMDWVHGTAGRPKRLTQRQ